IRSSVVDPLTHTVDRGTTTRSIIAAPGGDGQDPPAGIPGWASSDRGTKPFAKRRLLSDRADQQLVYSPLVHVDHVEPPALGLEALAFLRQPLEHPQHVARGGRELAILEELEAEALGELVGAQRAADQQRAVVAL